MNNNLGIEITNDKNNNQIIENLTDKNDDDDDEPFQIKYDRVVQKVKRVSIEDILKFSNLNNQNDIFTRKRGRKSLKESEKNNEKKNFFIVNQINTNNSNDENYENSGKKKHILNKKIKKNNFCYCVKSVYPNKIKKKNKKNK